MPRAYISSLAYHAPETVIRNADLAARFADLTAEQIADNTGILERRISAAGECASDLAVEAGKKLITSGALNPQEVDFLIFNTQTPDYFLPATACVIQDRLGIPRSAGAIDVNQGCSGFVYGLALAKGLIESGQARCVLLLNADTLSKVINPQDRSVSLLFGDAAAATVIRASGSADGGLGEFVFGSDGRGAKNLIVPAGGFRQARTDETAREAADSEGNIRSACDLYMKGSEIFRFSLQVVPRLLKSLLEKAGLSIEEVDFFLLHQANRFMLNELTRKMSLPPEKTPLCFDRVGNTTSCSIPIVIDYLLANNMLKSGTRLAVLGFGVGYSWAGGLVTWQ